MQGNIHRNVGALFEALRVLYFRCRFWCACEVGKTCMCNIDIDSVLCTGNMSLAGLRRQSCFEDNACMLGFLCTVKEEDMSLCSPAQLPMVLPYHCVYDTFLCERTIQHPLRRTHSAPPKLGTAEIRTGGESEGDFLSKKKAKAQRRQMKRQKKRHTKEQARLCKEQMSREERWIGIVYKLLEMAEMLGLQGGTMSSMQPYHICFVPKLQATLSYSMFKEFMLINQMTIEELRVLEVFGTIQKRNGTIQVWMNSGNCCRT